MELLKKENSKKWKFLKKIFVWLRASWEIQQKSEGGPVFIVVAHWAEMAVGPALAGLKSCSLDNDSVRRFEKWNIHFLFFLAMFRGADFEGNRESNRRLFSLRS